MIAFGMGYASMSLNPFETGKLFKAHALAKPNTVHVLIPSKQGSYSKPKLPPDNGNLPVLIPSKQGSYSKHNLGDNQWAITVLIPSKQGSYSKK